MPKHLITSATASDLGKKGNAIRWAPKPAQSITETKPAIPDNYAAIELIRVRAQIAKLNQQIDNELDEKKPDTRRLRDLADSKTRFAELERTLDGRPLPGSRRPKSDAGKVAVAGAWLDDQPAIDPTSPPVPQVASSPSTAACVPEAHVTPQQVVVLPVDSITQKPQDTQPADVGPVAETGD